MFCAIVKVEQARETTAFTFKEPTDEDGIRMGAGIPLGASLPTIIRSRPLKLFAIFLGTTLLPADH